MYYLLARDGIEVQKYFPPFEIIIALSKWAVKDTTKIPLSEDFFN